MCVTYIPPSDEQLAEFGVAPLSGEEWPVRTWQDYLAPIIRLDVEGYKEVVLATYGMVPKKHIPAGVKKYSTLNARAETIGQLRSFSKAWKGSHLCLVPMIDFFEPNWESGKHEPWAIGMADGSPFAVAGLWKAWAEEDGTESYSFTQLSINADEHPIMKKFHKPGEKRSLVILEKNEYDDWLSCRDLEVARSFLRLFPSDRMNARPA